MIELLQWCLVDPEIQSERDRHFRERRAEISELRDRYESLTPREQEVMQQVVSGLLNKQVAAELRITEFTVKVHRGQVMRKMRADSLADLVRMADKLGIRSRKTPEQIGGVPA